MPIKGQITDKCRRCLENLAVAGPSTVEELNALDPLAPDHKQTIKAAQQSKYVVAAPTHHRTDPARYSLTAKARAMLAPMGETAKAVKPVPTPPPTATRAKRYAKANTAGGNITPSVTYGSMTTKRMTHPCADMLAPATRSGAEQALQVPSRVNDQLHYRDGRVVHITTQLTT